MQYILVSRPSAVPHCPSKQISTAPKKQSHACPACLRLQQWCMSTSCCQSRQRSAAGTSHCRGRPGLARQVRTKNLAYKTVINFAYRQAISPAQERTCSVVQLAHVVVCISETKSLRLAVWRVEMFAGERRFILQDDQHMHTLLRRPAA